MLSKHCCCLVSLSPAILSWLAGLQSLWPSSSQYLCELLPDTGGFCTNPAFCMNVFPSVSGHFPAEPGQAGKVGPGSGRAVICSGSSQLLDAIRSNLSTRKHWGRLSSSTRVPPHTWVLPPLSASSPETLREQGWDLMKTDPRPSFHFSFTPGLCRQWTFLCPSDMYPQS